MSLLKLNGIVEYLPSELYIKVKAGTNINNIENELRKNNQQLAFEPIDFGYLFLGKSNYGTAGGQAACNISGPRRFKSENEARKERGWAESEYNQKFNIYRCGDCNDWHLASIK